MKELILASNSPRRRELLAQLYPVFRICPSAFEERGRKGLSARDEALAFACGKAKEVFARCPHSYVLGADTVVALGEEILGKPKSREDAARTLRRLSGITHSVFTGVCLMWENGTLCQTVETKVTFRALSDELIGEYVASGLPMDKAGSYGIQDGYPLVEGYEGSYTNVVGLPTELVRDWLRKTGLL